MSESTTAPVIAEDLRERYAIALQRFLDESGRANRAEAEVERLRAELAEANAHRERLADFQVATIERNQELLAERDALKAAIELVEKDAVEQQKTGATADRWKLGVYAQASRTRCILRDALDAPAEPAGSNENGERLGTGEGTSKSSGHIGGRANAEDCPACSGTNPPYPFICPGEPEGERNEYVMCNECGSEPTGNYPVAHKPSCSRMTIAPHLWPSPDAPAEETDG